jgi:hypothetical protein
MKVNDIITESASAEQLTEEFDLIESIIERLAEHNGVDAEVIWEDLETLTEDELYAFAVTSEPIMESQDVAEGVADTLPMDDAKKVLRQYGADHFKTGSETLYFYKNGRPFNLDLIWNDDATRSVSLSQLNSATRELKGQGMAEDWQKANKRDRTAGMSQKAVNAYRRENPGSKLKTAVTTKPSKLKRGSKASKRRKSYCSRSRGQMKMHSISCAKTPDKAICKARRRWNC